MAKAKKLELVTPEEIPKAATDIIHQRQELAAKKARLIERRDAFKDQMVDLRVEKATLQKRYDQKVAEASKQRSGLDEKEHLAAVLKDIDPPMGLNTVTQQLEAVIREIENLNNQVIELDKKDHQLRKDHGEVMRRHKCKQMEATWFEMLQYVEKAAPLHHAFLKHLHDFQQLNREFNGGINYVQAALQLGADAFLIDFVGNKLGEFARRDIWHTVRALTEYRHPANKYHQERAIQGRGISGFDSVGR